MVETKDTRSKKWMTTKEAADYLGVEKCTLYKYTSKRLVRFYKPEGGKNYFCKEDLDEYIASGLVETKEDYESRRSETKE